MEIRKCGKEVRKKERTSDPVGQKREWKEDRWRKRKKERKRERKNEEKKRKKEAWRRRNEK